MGGEAGLFGQRGKRGGESPSSKVHPQSAAATANAPIIPEGGGPKWAQNDLQAR